MAKNNLLMKIASILGWFVATVTSLAINFALISGTLSIPKIPAAINVWAGWLGVIFTALAFLLWLINWMKKNLK